MRPPSPFFLAMINIILKSVSLFCSAEQKKKSSQTHAIFYRSTQHHFIVNIVFAKKIQTIFCECLALLFFRINSIHCNMCLFGCCSIIIKISLKYMVRTSNFCLDSHPFSHIWNDVDENKNVYHFMHTQYIHVIDKGWFGLNFLFCTFAEALILMGVGVTYCACYAQLISNIHSISTWYTTNT